MELARVEAWAVTKDRQGARSLQAAEPPYSVKNGPLNETSTKNIKWRRDL